MQLIGLTDILRSQPTYQTLLEQLQDNPSQAWNVMRSARPFVLASLVRDWHHAPVIYLTARGKRAYTAAEQLPVWVSGARPIYRYAEPTAMFYDRIAWDASAIRDRVETLHALIHTPEDAPQPVVISSIRAMMQRTMPVSQFRKRTLNLAIGKRYKLDEMMRDWLNLGYEPVTMVVEPGTFSKRGGILDIYPLAAKLPIRLDFFDDELEVIRTFDPATQRTTDSLNQVVIPPAREALPDKMPQVANHLADFFQSLSRDDDDVSSMAQDADSLEAGSTFGYLEHYLPYIYDQPATLFDYVPDDALLIVDDWDEIQAHHDNVIHEAEGTRQNNQTTNQLPPDFPAPYVDWVIIQTEIDRLTHLHLSSTIGADEERQATVPRIFKPTDRFGGQLRHALNYVRQQVDDQGCVVVVTQQIDRLQKIWTESDSDANLPRVDNITEPEDMGSLAFVEGSLSGGWVLDSDDAELHLITDAEIFGWSRPEPRRRKSGSKRGNRRLPESDYSDWNPGDYVVHVDYGIGQFKGLKTRTIEGNEREYLLVEYANNGLLFVPIHQSDRLTRYVGADESAPKLNTIGKADVWTRIKNKAKENAQEEARELLQIYARRAGSSGYIYSPDSAWQHELEASFPYVETEDQLRVIREIKNDMEIPMPMDRLVCGDVGYGKTEVALRAAFKAVQDGKQVAVLVPTTVLADQHYKTFKRRMDAFPLEIASLSRFRTKAEQNEILKRLEQGQVDIVVGTHRLLSDDVNIPNLGLIVIDEEQRFGVKHKEHFKKLRANIDVLTLTATPIPRTLYMSMSGVRDISMLQTPPEDRLPVVTHVGAFDARLIRQAVLRELDRGGQVFVIHNRVKSLEMLREKLEDIIPEATMVTAHGQMSGRQLETIITDFSAGEYDILIATSIIENGIDMPNVNTLIVVRADWFGISQLYQIRGRVGRGATQAYAYFFHAGSKKLTDEARIRLETLAEYNELGAGLQISIKDLELRGAGDILSTKQTGHVASVGLQLYTQLLQQAVAEQKGDDVPVPTYEQERVVIDLPIPAYIPDEWIPEMALRLQLYRRIGSLRTLDDIEAMQQELADRFGKLPFAVEGLLYQIRVKILAGEVNAKSIIKPREHILIKIGWLVAIDREALSLELGEDVDVTRTEIQIPHDEEGYWQIRLLEILDYLKQGMPETIQEEAG